MHINSASYDRNRAIFDINQYETDCFQLVLRGVDLVGELLTGDDVIQVWFPAEACWKMFVVI